MVLHVRFILIVVLSIKAFIIFSKATYLISYSDHRMGSLLYACFIMVIVL